MPPRPFAALLLAAALAPAARADFLLVACNRSGEVVKLDPATGRRLAACDTGGDPHVVVLLPDGVTAAAGLYGAGTYGANPDPGDAAVLIDTRTMAVAGRPSVAPRTAPHGLAVDPGRPGAPLLVTAETTGELLRVPPAGGGEVAGLKVGGPAHWVVVPPGSRTAFTSNKEAKFLSAVDLDGPGVGGGVARVALPRGAQHLAASADGRRLFVADFSEPKLHVVSVAERRVTETIDLTGPAGWVGVAGPAAGGAGAGGAGGTVLVTAFTAETQPDRPGTVDLVDAATLENVATLRVGRWPFGSAADPAGTTAWVANDRDGTLSVIDLAARRVVGTLPAPGGPETVLYVPDPHPDPAPNFDR